jgi:hypothetical protein
VSHHPERSYHRRIWFCHLLAFATARQRKDLVDRHIQTYICAASRIVNGLTLTVHNQHLFSNQALFLGGSNIPVTEIELAPVGADIVNQSIPLVSNALIHKNLSNVNKQKQACWIRTLVFERSAIESYELCKIPTSKRV